MKADVFDPDNPEWSVCDCCKYGGYKLGRYSPTAEPKETMEVCEDCIEEFQMDEDVEITSDVIGQEMFDKLKAFVPGEVREEPEPTELRIIVKGGVVQDVLSTDARLKIVLLDFDNEEESEDAESEKHRLAKECYDNKNKWHSLPY